MGGVIPLPDDLAHPQTHDNTGGGGVSTIPLPPDLSHPTLEAAAKPDATMPAMQTQKAGIIPYTPEPFQPHVEAQVPDTWDKTGATIKAIAQMAFQPGATLEGQTDFGEALQQSGFDTSNTKAALGVVFDRFMNLIPKAIQEADQAALHPLSTLAGFGKEAAGAAYGTVRHPWDTASNIFNKTIGSTIEGLTGIEMAPGYNAMNPEDRASAIQDMAALTLSVVTGKASEALMAGMGPEAIEGGLAGAAKLPSSELQPYLATTNPSLLSKAGRGFVHGAAAGLGYGLAEAPGQEKPISSLLATTLVFGGIGAGMGTVFADPYAEVNRSNKSLASYVLAQRGLAFSLDKSAGNLQVDLQALSSSRNLAEATARSSIANGEVFRTVGNSPETEALLAQVAGRNGYVSFTRPGETIHIPGHLADDFDLHSWLQSGLIKNETVDYRGSPHVVEGADATHATLRDPTTGELVQAPLEEVSRSQKIKSWDAQGATAKDAPEDHLVQTLFEAFKDEVSSNPTRSYLQNLKQVLSTRGIPENQIEPLTHVFSDLLQRDAGLNTDPELTRIKSEQDTYMSQLARSSAEELRAKATRSGFYVDRRAGGGIVLRNAITGDEIPGLKSRQDAIEFLNHNGTPDGVDLTDGVKNMPAKFLLNDGPASDNARAPFKGYGKDALTRLASSMFRNWSFFNKGYFSRKLATFESFDEKYGTDLQNKMFYPLQDAMQAKYKFDNDVDAEHQPIIDITKGMSEEELQHITNHLETMSPDDIRSMFYNRPMSQTEMNLSDLLVRSGHSLFKLYKYTQMAKQIADVRDAAKAATMDATEQVKAEIKYKDNMKKLNKTWGLQDMKDPQTASFLQVAQLVAQHSQLPATEFRPEGAFALADAIKRNTLSADEYARVHNLSGAQLAASKMLSDLYNKMGGERPRFWINHFKDFKRAIEFNLEDDSEHSGDIGEDLAKEMAKTGELDDHIDNPHEGLQAWKRAYSTQRYILEPWREAKKYLGDVYGPKATGILDDIRRQDPGHADILKANADEYLRDVRGYPDSHNDVLEKGIKEIWSNIPWLGKHVPLTEGFLKRAVNTISGWTAAGSLGFKPELGMRDFFTTLKSFDAWYGSFGLTGKFVKNLLGGDFELAQSRGVAGTGGISSTDIYSPAELREANQGIVKSLGEKMGTLGLATTGQRWLYPHMSAAVYETLLEHGHDVLEQLGSNQIDKATAFDRLRMYRYSDQVTQKFDALVSSGRMNEANEYLARVSSSNIVAVHGLANHPLGWGSVVGRLAFQFGQWGAWNRNFVANLLSRGSTKQALSGVGRLVASDAATWGVGKALGLDLRSWSNLNSLPQVLRLGPVGQFALSLMQGSQGQHGTNQQQGAFSHFVDLVTGSDAEQARSEDWITKRAKGLRSFVPGGGAAYNWYDALDHGDYNPLQVMGRGLGWKIGDEGNLLDYITKTH